MKFFIRTMAKELIFLQILNILNKKVNPVQGTGNQPRGSFKTLQTGTFYLNSERPLWILQDQKNDLNTVQVQVQKSENEKVKYDQQLKPIYYQNRQQPKSKSFNNKQRMFGNFKTKAQNRIAANKAHKGLQLPHRYIPLKKNSNSRAYTSRRRYQNSKFIQNMPVFDAVPGEEAYTHTRPIFIYTGNKGRMLLNTMMSGKKYPMQEPVPGQILYPPQTLVFKPKPLVETFRQKFNVTMIPFFAYEAIDPRFFTTLPPTTFEPPTNYKKSKNYKAFHSPDKVLSQPVTDYSQYDYQVEHTTNAPPTLEKPFNNHRFSTDSVTPFTTPLPHKKFEVTYDDGADKFQITYEDDTPSTYLESPTKLKATTFAPVTYESYKFDQNYYAFPLYTMSKLMDNNDITTNIPYTTTSANKLSEQSLEVENISVEKQRIEKYIDTALKEDNENWRDKSNEDTWFILNSR